jgi:peptide/nickel transport system substrate-binding protein
MRHIFLRSCAHSAAAALILASALPAATRPHYGGTLRVEVREALQTADPPDMGAGMAQLNRQFKIAQWVAGSRAVFSADENAPGGRPFLDSVEIQMARTLREQAIDLELGKADVVELDPSEPRRASGRKVWSSSPVRVLVLLVSPRVGDARVREALALSVDRSSIHNVLLQRQGEISGALLPQWLSGYAFLFRASQDAGRARALAASVPPAARTLSFAVPDASNRRIGDRIALDARDVGLTLAPAGAGSNADVRLVEARITSADPAAALTGIAAALGLPAPARAGSPEALYSAERSLLDGFRVTPLFHLPDLYGAGARVKGGPGIGPLGEWRFENLWLEPGRP